MKNHRSRGMEWRNNLKPFIPLLKILQVCHKLDRAGSPLLTWALVHSCHTLLGGGLPVRFQMHRSLPDVTPRRKENRCMAGLPNPSILHQLPPAAQMHREDRRGHTAKKWILFIILSLASAPQCWVLEKETLFSTFP